MPIGQNQASYANKSMHRIVNVKISSYAEYRHRNTPVWQISSLGEGDKDTQKD